MFSFHKPKTYRSLAGCCICRAKSSSSRFTDSARYEADFEKCFNIDEQRHGEICNACVLLVKRWKKLPKDSLRNWEHVSTPALSLAHRLAPQLRACKYTCTFWQADQAMVGRVLYRRQLLMVDKKWLSEILMAFYQGNVCK